MPAEPHSDADLVRAAQHDSSQFDPLYRRYAGPVYRFVLGRVGNAAEAEDVTSAAFLEALSGLPAYREQGRFAAWLFTIARRQASAHARRSHPTDALVADVAAPAVGPSIESLDMIARGLDALDDTSRDAVLLRFFSDLPVKDVADVLGKGESATKMVLHRALARMRDTLAEDQGA